MSKAIKIICIFGAILNFTLSLWLRNLMAAAGWFTALVFMISTYIQEKL